MSKSESAALPPFGGLYDLKMWFTLGEASKLLAQRLSGDVSEADVLRLGLDGQLVLSVRFVNRVFAKRGRRVAPDHAAHEDVPRSDGLGTERLHGGPEADSRHVVEFEGDVVQLEGVFDLPMFPAARAIVEAMHLTSLHGQQAAVTDAALDGVCVTRGETYLLLEDHKEVGTCERYTLPEGAHLVVLPHALRELLGELYAGTAGAVPVGTADLSTRERYSLLRILYGMAVAEPYRFDPDSKRGEAAAIIASATDAAGCSVSDDTVRKWLREAAKVAR